MKFIKKYKMYFAIGLLLLMLGVVDVICFCKLKEIEDVRSLNVPPQIEEEQREIVKYTYTNKGKTYEGASEIAKVVTYGDVFNVKVTYSDGTKKTFECVAVKPIDESATSPYFERGNFLALYIPETQN
jgi:hypothetical protein